MKSFCALSRRRSESKLNKIETLSLSSGTRLEEELSRGNGRHSVVRKVSFTDTTQDIKIMQSEIICHDVRLQILRKDWKRERCIEKFLS